MWFAALNLNWISVCAEVKRGTPNNHPLININGNNSAKIRNGIVGERGVTENN